MRKFVKDGLRDLRRKLEQIGSERGPFDQRRCGAQAAQAQRLLKEVGRFSELVYAQGDDSAAEIGSLYGTAVDRFRAAIQAAWPPGFDEDYARLKAGDPAGLETAVAFLEADPWFFRSGYFKGYLIRCINRLELTPAYAGRLRRVVLAAIDSRDRREFRYYCRLARKVYDPEWRREVVERLEHPEPGVRRRARWVLDACDRRN